MTTSELLGRIDAGETVTVGDLIEALRILVAENKQLVADMDTAWAAVAAARRSPGPAPTPAEAPRSLALGHWGVRR